MADEQGDVHKVESEKSNSSTRTDEEVGVGEEHAEGEEQEGGAGRCQRH